jgi:hypothetical protein
MVIMSTVMKVRVRSNEKELQTERADSCSTNAALRQKRKTLRKFFTSVYTWGHDRFYQFIHSFHTLNYYMPVQLLVDSMYTTKKV